MRAIRLGRTNIYAASSSFGALPIQRVSFAEAEKILRRAFEGGINFYDTARMYTDSEEKLGAALGPVRREIFIATKTKGTNAQEITRDMETSLAALKTDYIDILQFHNLGDVPRPGDGTGRYEAMERAKAAGKIRFIGVTSHSCERALDAAQSGLYDTLQYPFSVLSSEKEIALAAQCEVLDVGFLAMKALGGGLIRNIRATFAFMREHANAVPLWGIQKLEELEEFLALENNPPQWDEAMRQEAQQEKQTLGANFCRGCGYCLPCPAAIPLPTMARMELFLRRTPWRELTTPAEQEKMARAENCTECGACAARCPYGLDTPRLVRENYAFYKEFIEEKKRRGVFHE